MRAAPDRRRPKAKIRLDDELMVASLPHLPAMRRKWDMNDAGPTRGSRMFETHATRCLTFVAVCRYAAILGGCLTFVGCATKENRIEPFFVRNPTLGPLTIAVAPAINLSGSLDFDRGRFADLMAIELSYADGISVIPVSRVLGVLSAQGRETIESPGHAGHLAHTLGADAILVFAVTRYDPYDPPSIGITAQLYAARAAPGVSPADQGENAKPQSGSAGDMRSDTAALLAQSSAVHDAAHAAVTQDIQDFARCRSADNSPYGWRKFVVSQQGFIQYCCYATVRSLLGGEPYTATVGNHRER